MTTPDADRALASDAYQQKLATAIADATVAYAGAA
jgi:N-acetylmuramoyl-L-alanine amidase